MRCGSTGGPSGSVSPSRAARFLARGKNLYLAGFMGTGKSVVARALAQRLGVPWVDLDALIEDEAGMSVAEIFHVKGERAFRAAEHRALRRVAREGGRVVALGGGAVCFARNREALRGTGPVVLLTATPETIWRRVGRSATRPLLKGRWGRERMLRLLEGRRADYRRYRLRVATDGLRPSAVTAAVLRRIENAARKAHRASTAAGVRLARRREAGVHRERTTKRTVVVPKGAA